ncbi:MAG TPA: serine/threonine-protein kinase [Dongiaceae bacterium]|nr:serine/threonine-protein kinase [Dongiaceae bacterium]
MANAEICSQCGAELDPAAPRGLCGHCLISLGLASGPGESFAETPLPVPGPEPADSLASPTLGRIGDYELIEEIARGGMGVVYKARQLSLGRMVAVKMVLAGQFVDKKVIQRFRGEVTTAALLQHPNIVPVHEVGMHAGQPFFSMDYVEGQNLGQLVGNRPLSPKKAARYLKLIAEAIHYAHSQGILHRDLKPSNVLVDAATDQPRVTDFGLATRLDGESSLTLTGQVLGSPGFIPPEQASPGRGKAGRRSDVYALGAILYHLLTARAPFQAESLPAIVNLVLTTEPVPPRLLNPGIPRDLETVCLKCLEKEPERRYATGKELADELGRFLDDQPVHARPVSRPERAWRWCRRSPVLATLAALVLLLLLVVLVGTPVALIGINRARLEAERNLYAADMRLASDALRDGALGQVQELLGAHEPRKGAEDLRGFEWRYLRQAVDQSGLVTHQLQGLRAKLVFDNPSLIAAGGTLYNLQEETSQILAWDMATWAQLPLKAPGQRAYARWWWRPRAQAALAVNDQERSLAVYRLPTFEKVSVTPLPGQASQAAVSKDLRTLAVAFQDGGVQRILVWDLAANS